METDDWNLDYFQVSDIISNSTIVQISKLRQAFTQDDVGNIRTHICETYANFIGGDVEISFGGTVLDPIEFKQWSYCTTSPPNKTSFEMASTEEHSLKVSLEGGLTIDREPSKENYGVYFYCNGRLVNKEIKIPDVGFLSGYGGVPHPNASLARIIVELDGPAIAMPWNSSKSAINYSHPAFSNLRVRLFEFVFTFQPNLVSTNQTRRKKH